MDPSTGIASVLFTFHTSPDNTTIELGYSKIRGNLAMVCAGYDSIYLLINLEIQSAIYIYTPFVRKIYLALLKFNSQLAVDAE